MTKKQTSGKLLLLLWLVLVLLGAAVYDASLARGQSPYWTCVDKLADITNPRLMSRTTAERKARKICTGLKSAAPSYYKAITQ